MAANFFPLLRDVATVGMEVGIAAIMASESADTAASAAASATAKSGEAATSQAEAAASAASAAASATTATTKAGEASVSASGAATSATTATTAASNAATSATNASASAATATTKAGEASTSAGNAAGSAVTATAKAGEALTAATRAEAAAAVASSAGGGTLIATGVSGTGDAVAVTVGVAVPALYAGLTVRFQWPGTSTTTAPTLALTSAAGALPAKPVLDAAGAALVAGALAAGVQVEATYVTASGGQWRVPVPRSAEPFAGVVPVTGAVTLDVSHLQKLVVCGGGGGYTVSVPPLTVGRVWIKNHTAAAVWLAGAGGATVNGVGLWLLPVGGDAALFLDGSNAVYALGGSTPASGCVFSATDKAAGTTIYSGGLVASATGTTTYDSVRGVTAISRPTYFEVLATAIGTGVGWGAGVASSTASMSGGVGYGVFDSAGAWGYLHGGQKVSGGGAAAFGSTIPSGGVIGVAVNPITGTIWFSINGVWQGGGNPSTGANPAFSGMTGVLKPAFAGMVGAVANARFSATDWSYPAPAGFLPIP